MAPVGARAAPAVGAPVGVLVVGAVPVPAPEGGAPGAVVGVEPSVGAAVPVPPAGTASASTAAGARTLPSA
ncbi:MAG: hypothetical protein KDB33_17905, partial [Acidimicrobiales bacterium]|nr:hypothetical protein [Acidimicrobiales bacterium]